MICSCRKSKEKTLLFKGELRRLLIETKFNEQELKEMRTRFYEQIYPQTKMNKFQFREAMGILGMESTNYISDRIFNMIDAQGDEQINFEHFIQYLNLVQFGTPEDKSELSYYLIDTKKKGYFDQNDFLQFIQCFLEVWSTMTGTSIDERGIQNFNTHSEYIFKQFDQDGSGKITLQNYKIALQSDPNLLEIFQYLNKNLTSNYVEEQKHQFQNCEKIINQFIFRNYAVAKKLDSIEKQLEALGDLMFERQNKGLNMQKMQQQQQQSLHPSNFQILGNNGDSDSDSNMFFYLSDNLVVGQMFLKDLL